MREFHRSIPVPATPQAAAPAGLIGTPAPGPADAAAIADAVAVRTDGFDTVESADPLGTAGGTAGATAAADPGSDAAAETGTLRQLGRAGPDSVGLWHLAFPDWLFRDGRRLGDHFSPGEGWFDTALPASVFAAASSASAGVRPQTHETGLLDRPGLAGLAGLAGLRRGDSARGRTAGSTGDDSAEAVGRLRTPAAGLSAASGGGLGDTDSGSHDVAGGRDPDLEEVPAVPLRHGDLPPGAVLGQYRLVRLIGRGAKGIVYEADDELLGRRVAVKVLAGELVSGGRAVYKRFLLEARIASRLHHPNCVTVFGVGKQDGYVFYAMPLIRGVSAQTLLDRKGPLDPVLAARIVESAARGLHAAHGIGVIHRDVKPPNILIGEDGLVRITDFGMAKAADAALANLTEPGRWMGTPHYMSPEQCLGLPADNRSDLYALGATFYCLLTGRPPFEEGSPQEVMRRQVEDPVPDVRVRRPGLSEPCARLIQRVMAKDPAARPQTAAELADLLRSVRKGPVPLYAH